MRRRLWCFVVWSGILLGPAFSFAAARSRAPRRAAVSRSAARAARPSPATLKASRRKPFSLTRKSSSAGRRRARTKRLRPTEPVETALIDPVPLGRFPLPAALKGSHDSLLRQNTRSREDGLTRIPERRRYSRPAPGRRTGCRAGDLGPGSGRAPAGKSPILPPLDRAVSVGPVTHSLRTLSPGDPGQLRRTDGGIPAAPRAGERQRCSRRWRRCLSAPDRSHHRHREEGPFDG